MPYRDLELATEVKVDFLYYVVDEIDEINPDVVQITKIDNKPADGWVGGRILAISVDTKEWYKLGKDSISKVPEIHKDFDIDHTYAFYEIGHKDVFIEYTL